MCQKDINSFFCAQRTRSFHHSNDLQRKKKRKLAQKQGIKTDQNKSALN